MPSHRTSAMPSPRTSTMPSPRTSTMPSLRTSTMPSPRTSTMLSPRTSTIQTQSWRRTVADALALAQSAVELDSKNTDPMSALDAYAESVCRLRDILARLERHGAHAKASQLAAITDGYCERMRLLCVACAVPPPPYDHPPSDSNNPSLPQPVALELPPPPAYDESRQRPIQTKACIQTQP